MQMFSMYNQSLVVEELNSSHNDGSVRFLHLMIQKPETAEQARIMMSVAADPARFYRDVCAASKGVLHPGLPEDPGNLGPLWVAVAGMIQVQLGWILADSTPGCVCTCVVLTTQEDHRYLRDMSVAASTHACMRMHASALAERGDLNGIAGE